MPGALCWRTCTHNETDRPLLCWWLSYCNGCSNTFFWRAALLCLPTLANTSQVVLVPVSLDGNDLGSPAQLPSFSTGDALIPPRLSDGLGINPVVGPDRFSVYNISQDKPGFAYLLVTKPHNQVNSQVHTGPS